MGTSRKSMDQVQSRNKKELNFDSANVKLKCRFFKTDSQCAQFIKLLTVNNRKLP